VEVYRYEQDRLELLWTVNLHGEEYYVFIGQGSDPLIGVVGSDDGNMHVFDLQGRPVLGGSSYWGRHVGDVGGYVTFFGDQILTYRITRRTGCTPPGG
jgi:hypothetical protein